MNSTSTGYRIFISYSRNDDVYVQKIEAALRHNGLTPMRDKNFAFGVGFHDQIKRFVEYAHVFLPVITRPSCFEPTKDGTIATGELQCKRPGASGWVHQEIGYAIAQNVPVLPVVIDCEPGQWLQTLHSVVLEQEKNDLTEDNLERLFNSDLFRGLVNRFRHGRYAIYRCGFLQEDRALMLAEYSEEVAEIQSLIRNAKSQDGQPNLSDDTTGHASLEDEKTRELGRSTTSVCQHGANPLSSIVRQKGALSSFHIPDDPLTSEVWTRRYGECPKPEHHRRLQRDERLALTSHAKKWGAKLIIDPSLPYTDQGPAVRKARLESLLKFLKSDSAEKTQVAIMYPPNRSTQNAMTSDEENQKPQRAESITIVGNWFLAESVSAISGSGYYQTIFTRHAPSLQARIEEFDAEFDYLLTPWGWSAQESRQKAIEHIEELIRQCTTT